MTCCVTGRPLARFFLRVARQGQVRATSLLKGPYVEIYIFIYLLIYLFIYAYTYLPFFKRMLLSMRYAVSLTAARFLCGAAGAPCGGGGGSSLALEEAGIVELLDEELAPLPNARASVCSIARTKKSAGCRKPRVRPMGPVVWYHAALLSSCRWKGAASAWVCNGSKENKV